MKYTVIRLLGCVAILFFAACTAKEEKHPEVMNGILDIAYTKAGEGDTALVFVHGWGINKEYWQSQEEEFKKRFTVVSIDIGGHGASGHNRASWKIEDFSNDVMAVLDSLNLNKVILVGHSMGGDIILDVAYKIPDRIIGFIGIDNFKDVGVPLSPGQQMEVKMFMAALDTSYKQTAEAFSRASLFPANYADTVSVNRVIKDIVQTDSVVAVKSIKGMFEFVPKETALLQEIHTPVHLIVSDYTPTQQDSLAKYCKAGFDVKTIKGTGHYPMIEKPAEFNALLAQTIDEIAKGR